MMKPMIQVMGKLDRRLLQGAMLMLVALMVFESWIFVLRKPYAEYQRYSLPE